MNRATPIERGAERKRENVRMWKPSHKVTNWVCVRKLRGARVLQVRTSFMWLIRVPVCFSSKPKPSTSVTDRSSATQYDEGRRERGDIKATSGGYSHKHVASRVRRSGVSELRDTRVFLRRFWRELSAKSPYFPSFNALVFLSGAIHATKIFNGLASLPRTLT